MFVNNIVGTQKVRTLTETHPALPAAAAMRLRVETGNTDRASSLVGNFTINHSPTKEVGGGFRHVARTNLRQQGDIPAGSVYTVFVNNDTVAGEARCGEAFICHLVSLLQLGGDFKVDDSCVDSRGFVTNFKRVDDDTEVDWDVVLEDFFTNQIPRLLARES